MLQNFLSYMQLYHPYNDFKIYHAYNKQVC